MTSDELVDALKEEFCEVKRFSAENPMGRFCAYTPAGEKAFGQTLREALSNLLTIVNEKHQE